MFKSEMEIVEKEPELKPLPFTTWHLPLFRPSSFIERTSLQVQLADKLKPSWDKNTQEAGLVACCGLGGTGKTSLARDYIHRPYGNPTYTLRAWFSGERLRDDYVEFAKELGLILPDEKIERTVVIKKVKKWLEEHPGWLLVYDNVDDNYDNADSTLEVQKFLELFLPTKGGNILVTSRVPKWSAASVIEINSLQPQEAEAMVYQLSGHKDADTPALVKELGYLPLAIAQASAYMKENGKTAHQYLTLYQTESKALLLDETLPSDQQHQHGTVAVTWKLNLQRVAAFSPSAQTALTCLSYVHAEGIPYGWLQQIVFGDCTSKTEIECDKALKVLRSYSLIHYQPELKTISVHRLVQAITRQELSPKQHVETLIKAIEALAKHYDSDNIKITENRALIPHLLAALKQVEALSPSPTELIPANALLLNKLGVAYTHLGDSLQAKTFLERALAITEKHYGPDHPETGKTLTNLGSAYGALGDYLQAKTFLERALAITEKHYGPDHPETGKTLMNLGITYGALGDYEKKKDLLTRALEIIEKHYGPDHPETGKTLTNLGTAYGQLGDYAKKKELLLRALAIKEKHYGKDHPSTGITLINLGNAYGALGDYSMQKEVLLRALEINEKHYGKEHPSTGITLHNLGNAWNHLGDYEKAKDFLTRALAIYEKHYDKGNHYIAEALTEQGNALNHLGDYEKAKELLTRALDIKEKHYKNKDHSEIGITLTYLGDTYFNLKDMKSAYTYQKRAYDILFKFYGAENQYTKYASQALQELALQALKTPQPPLVFSSPSKASNNNNEAKSSTSASMQEPKPKKSECTIA